MKRILITGADSYIGTSFEKWCSQYPDMYSIDTIDMRSASWRNASFEGYDTVLHVAGIAHVSAKRKMEQLYYKVNRDLAIETAEKVKRDGVKQFIFMSSIIVYGDCGEKIINRTTIPKPNNFYGKSKLQAEEGIKALQSNNFKVVVIRPPMVYGKGCKGNYQKLTKFISKVPVFPYYENKRSMIYINNLCEFIRLIIENIESGIFFPQNAEYVQTFNLVRNIAEIHEKKLKLTKLFNPLIKMLSKKIGVISKLFGDCVYEKDLSKYKINYCVFDFKSSIMYTEG